MKAQVLCRVKPGETRTFELPKGEAVMGRDQDAIVDLAMDGVSRRHARITWDGRNHWLEDLKSTNGTFLNGQSVQRDKLRHLDVITLGKKVDLLFLKRGEGHAVTRKGVLGATLAPVSPELIAVELPLGDTSLGRNTACNVVLDKAAISKMHARIERTAEQVLLRDLESANGTFVNGARVQTAVLRDQDLLSLAGVEEFRVLIQFGAIVTTATEAAPSGAGADAETVPETLLPPALPPKQFSNNWKTRFDWSQDEKDEIKQMQRRLAEEDALKASRPGARPAPRPTRPQPRPDSVTAPADQTLPLPPASVTIVPAAPITPTTRVSPKAPTAPIPIATAKPEDRTAAVPVVKAPSPVTPLAVEGHTLIPGALRQPRPAGIAEVRLTGSGFDLVATEPGLMTIGRAMDASLRLDNATVSRHHARLTLTEDRSAALLQDLGGANGTLLNGAQVKKAERLSEGDIVQIGDVRLLVQIQMQASD